MLHKFKIGKVSQLLGVAPETIRYYERKGVVKPKTEESGHRYYDITDVCLMGKARAYMQYGFTLEQARALLECADTDGILQIYGQRAEEIERELEKGFQTLKSIRRRQREVSELMGKIGRFELAERPALRLIDTFRNNVPIDAEEGLQTHSVWMQKQLYTFAYLRFDWADIVRGETRRIVGAAVREEDLNQACLPMGPEVRRLPPARCLHTVKRMGSASRNPGGVEELFTQEFQYMRGQGLTLRGGVFCRTVLVHRDGEDHAYLREVWMEV